MITIGICDDEPIVCQKITKYIKKYTQFKYNVKVFSYISGGALLEAMGKERLDILYLDLELGDSFGLEIARQIRAVGYQVYIIFLTNYPQYMESGYEVEAFRYRTKPIDEKVFQQDLLAMLELITAAKEEAVLAVRTLERVYPLKTSAIIAVFLEDKRVVMVTEKGQIYPLDNMTYWRDILLPLGFGEPYGKILVNLAHVVNFTPKEILLSNNETVPVSREKFPQFRRLMMGLQEG